MAWQTPIFDRTQADVDYVKTLNKKIYEQGFNSLSQAEKTAWLDGLKGALNPKDLNRIERNIEYLAELLTMYDYAPNLNAIKTNWQFTDLNGVSSIDDINRVANNALALINAFYAQRTQPPSNLANPRYVDINNLEKMQLELKQMIENMVSNFVYSNTINADQKALPQSIFYKEPYTRAYVYRSGVGRAGQRIVLPQYTY